MKVLFYSELYPIRENPHEYLNISREFANLIINTDLDCRLVCNEEIYRTLYLSGELICANRIPLDADVLKWIKNNEIPWDDKAIGKWINYVKSKNNNELKKYLNDIKNEVFDFDVIVIWGKNNSIKEFAKLNNIQVVYLELTPSRKPYYEGIFISNSGVNGDLVTKLSNENNISLVNLPNNKERLLFPLQLYDDLNFQIFSPFNSLIELVDYVINTFPKDRYDIYIKGHPGSSIRNINKVKESQAIEYAEENGINVILDRVPLNTEHFKTFNSVVTVNSSVGYEAAKLGLKVFLLGDACYRGCIKTYEVTAEKESCISTFRDNSLIAKFEKEYFYQWEELDNYLKSNFSNLKNPFKGKNPLLTSLSTLINKKIQSNTSTINIDNEDFEDRIIYKTTLNHDTVHFSKEDKSLDSVLFILEIYDSEIVSGMTCDTQETGFYKISSKNVNGTVILMIGYSMKIVGRLNG